MLGDSLRVGPQVYPAAARGLPVVQRGPHGMFSSPKAPIKTFEGNEGIPQLQYQWWYANRRQPGLSVPQSEVVGVMGMGQGSTTRIPNEAAIKNAALNAQRYSGAAFNAGLEAVQALDSAAAQAQRQNKEQYDRDLGYAVGRAAVVMREASGRTQDPSGFASLISLYGEINRAVAHVARLGKKAFKRTPQEQERFEQGIFAAEKNSQLYRDYDERAPSDAEIVAKAVELTVPFQLMDASSELRNWIEANWWKIGLGLAGAAFVSTFVYGASQSAGRAIGQRIL